MGDGSERFFAYCNEFVMFRGRESPAGPRFPVYLPSKGLLIQSGFYSRGDRLLYLSEAQEGRGFPRSRRRPKCRIRLYIRA
jgi:hypothetical protein